MTPTHPNPQQNTHPQSKPPTAVATVAPTTLPTTAAGVGVGSPCPTGVDSAFVRATVRKALRSSSSYRLTRFMYASIQRRKTSSSSSSSS